MQPVMIYQRGEPGYAPLEPWKMDEEDAQAVVRGVIATLKKHLTTVPIWDQFLFSGRAEKVLRREKVTTWAQLWLLTAAVEGGAVHLKSVGPRMLKEWGEGLAYAGTLISH